MTFQINGEKGIFDKFDIDASSKYGMNAAANHRALAVSPITNDTGLEAPILDFSPTEAAQEANIEMLEKFVNDNDVYLNSLPPLDYEYRYMPNVKDGKIDKRALFGAAIGDMGKTEMPLEDFEDAYLPDKNNMTAKPIDINNDGKIDITEYSATILASDMMSKPNPDISNVDGSMNAKGMNAILEYSKKANADAASKLYTSLYNKYELNNL